MWRAAARRALWLEEFLPLGASLRGTPPPAAALPHEMCCHAAHGDEFPWVLQVPASAVELPLELELPVSVALDGSVAWRLVEEGSKMSVPAQVGRMPGTDGLPLPARRRLLAVIPPGGEQSGPRRFRLTSGGAPAASGFEFEDVSAQSLRLARGAGRCSSTTTA